MKRNLPKGLREWLILVFLIVFIGYPIGTGLLLGPLRSVINYSRDHNWSQSSESASVMLLIALLILISVALSLWALTTLRNSKSSIAKVAIFVIPLILSTVAVAYMMNPAAINTSGENHVVSDRFTIGPYPEKAQVEKLKAEGYTGIITLLHPAVAPFELKLLSDEEENARSSGIELIKAPMLPWLSENTQSIEVIKKLVKSGKGKYYVHCYLGKDRVNVVKNLISRISDTTKIGSTVAHRTLEEIGSFERGDIYKVTEGLYFIPYPTKEEFLGYILAGNYKTVVNLLNPTTPDIRKIVEEEKAMLNPYELSVVNLPLAEDASNKKVKEIADQILESPRPLVVHHWNTESKSALAILKEFKRRQLQVVKVKDL
ncbi:hypothetical protein [Desertivirga arenae]|uniref:hypothetical protein n=1 Tax=Desertivirga arenae TaxID=2810309 RepID=UPI001A95A163|nr:hypothetical protein [Pedobacter sp. SYSU D00823]